MGVTQPDPAIALLAILSLVAAALLLLHRAGKRDLEAMASGARQSRDSQSPDTGSHSDLVGSRTDVAPRSGQKHEGSSPPVNKRRLKPRSLQGSVLRGRIDHLQKLTEELGEENCDAALKQVAMTMRSALRTGDLILGGERNNDDKSFIIIARNTSEEEARDIAQRMLNILTRFNFEAMGSQEEVTASFGVATRREEESVDEWHARAGLALAAAQANGKGHILTASEWEQTALAQRQESLH